MLTVENIETAGWRPALRGMRNPLDSWDRADSEFTHDNPGPFLGENDESLMRRLIGQGSADHCKFRRKLAIYADVTAPLYWWKEMSTYKVGTVATTLINYLNDMRDRYFKAKKTGDEEWARHIWRRIVQLLPESWMQRRTVMLNYEVMANIYKSRRNHKLKEWHDFIDAMVSELPYPWIFTGEGC